MQRARQTNRQNYEHQMENNKQAEGLADRKKYTICPRSSDPFYLVTYYIKWVTTSWTYSIKNSASHTRRRH